MAQQPEGDSTEKETVVTSKDLGPNVPFADFNTTDNTHVKGDAIQEMPARTVAEIIMTIASDVDYFAGGYYHRNTPMAVYVDGVKAIGPVNLPKSAIQEVRVGGGAGIGR